MSTDFAAKERAFIDGLKEDTGRDLAEWMQAIARQRFAHRNDVIDWLRQQGFAFPRASWLERIHANAGRPIYAGDADTPATAAAADHGEPPAPPPPRQDHHPAPPQPDTAPPPIPAPAPAPAPAQPMRRAPAPAADELAAVLARAKAYRPLAAFLIDEVRRRLPDAILRVSGDHVAFLAPAEFAVLAPGPKELKLGLALAERATDDRLRKAKLPGTGAHITHMIVLNDARQITPELLGWLAEAAAAANA